MTCQVAARPRGFTLIELVRETEIQVMKMVDQSTAKAQATCTISGVTFDTRARPASS